MSQVNRDAVEEEGAGAEGAEDAEAWTAFINAIGTDGLGVYDDDGDEINAVLIPGVSQHHFPPIEINAVLIFISKIVKYLPLSPSTCSK